MANFAIEVKTMAVAYWASIFFIYIYWLKIILYHEEKNVLFLLFSSIMLCAYADGPEQIVYLTIDITTAPGQGGPPKSPTQPVCLYQNGHTLNFGTDYSGCAVTLIDENELIEYSGIVGSDGIVVLPEYLMGVFELRLTADNIVYAGEILFE